jgi:hypothetical protein
MLRYDDHDCGFSWMPDDPLRRTSHALDTPGGVWLIDPVDEREALERATSLGSPAGVVQLLDRHARDCAFIAARLGVPHLRIPREIPGSPFTVVPVLRVPRWREVALWWPEQRALVVAEALGTTPIHRLDTGAAGVHPLLRILPPRSLRRFEPEHLLVGHGRGVHGPAARTAVTGAYARSRRDLPKLAARFPGMVRAARAARR